MDPDHQAAVELAAESLAENDATGWFERLYAAAERGEARVPWDREVPNPLIVEWATHRGLCGDARRALVVGSGLGADSEFIASLGFATVAFDIAETAIRTTRERFPDSPVDYVAADLLDPPAAWRHAFDLVVESITVQSLPEPLRGQAIAQVGGFVAPGGTLLVVATAASPLLPPEGPPWPLTRAEVDTFAAPGLRLVEIEDLRDAKVPELHRWRAEFHRPTGN